MIQRFMKVVDGLYRGGAPSPKDVLMLKQKYGIKKIISLDEKWGRKIDRTCKLLNIEHVMLPIEMNHLIQSLISFLMHDFKELFLEGGPVFVHCAQGKDRTGLAVALVKCKYFNEDPNKAIEEAKSLGFGLHVNKRAIAIFEKLIKACEPDTDNNSADIVSNERAYISDNRDSFLDEGHQGSFAPHLNVTRQNPMDSVYNFILDQSPTRENYPNYKSITEHISQESTVPLVGIYNNDAGVRGFGPSENVGGFIYD